MWTDRQTDMTKLVVAFRNFANAPKIGVFTYVVRKETGTSINNTTGSRYIFLKPIVFL
jgi:hypothetical protein